MRQRRAEADLAIADTRPSAHPQPPIPNPIQRTHAHTHILAGVSNQKARGCQRLTALVHGSQAERQNAELREADNRARRKMSGVERALQKKQQLHALQDQEVTRVRQKYKQTKAREVEALKQRMAEEEKRKMKELDEEERRVNSFAED